MCFGGDNLILIQALYNVTGKNTHLEVKGLWDKANEFFRACHLLTRSKDFRRFVAFGEFDENDRVYIGRVYCSVIFWNQCLKRSVTSTINVAG